MYLMNHVVLQWLSHGLSRLLWLWLGTSAFGHCSSLNGCEHHAV